MNAHLKLAFVDEKSIRDAADGLLEASCIQFTDDSPFPHLTFTTVREISNETFEWP